MYMHGKGLLAFCSCLKSWNNIAKRSCVEIKEIDLLELCVASMKMALLPIYITNSKMNVVYNKEGFPPNIKYQQCYLVICRWEVYAVQITNLWYNSGHLDLMFFSGYSISNTVKVQMTIIISLICYLIIPGWLTTFIDLFCNRYFDTK